MKKPMFKQFTLQKVKLINGGGLDAKFEIEEAVGQEVYHIAEQVKSSKDVHPDLSGLFTRLKPMVAKIFQFSFIRDVISNPEFEATQEQTRFAERSLQEVYDNIKITGVALSGIDENKGLIITATFTADTNQVMAINTHRIKYIDKTHYGFEEQLEEIITIIEQEVFEFIYNAKAAQLEIFGDDDTDGKMASANDS